MEVLGEQEDCGMGVRDVVSCEMVDDEGDVDEVLKAFMDSSLKERADSLRCQVKITTRHNLQLRMSNHTERDVYVRLLGHGERISGTGLLALKDSVHLSPLKPSVTPEEVEIEDREKVQERQEDETANRTRADEEKRETNADNEDDESDTLTISDTAYDPCASMVPTPVDESQIGLDILFQSPARMLKELHDNPEMQVEFQAERERERASEAYRQSSCNLSNGRRQLQACLRSAARLVVMATVLLMILLPLLLLLLESDLDISFLHDIRQTPEFEEFHYEYYCPLRQWFLCRLELITEQLWGE